MTRRRPRNHPIVSVVTRPACRLCPQPIQDREPRVVDHCVPRNSPRFPRPQTGPRPVKAPWLSEIRRAFKPVRSGSQRWGRARIGGRRACWASRLRVDRSGAVWAHIELLCPNPMETAVNCVNLGQRFERTRRIKNGGAMRLGEVKAPSCEGALQAGGRQFDPVTAHWKVPAKRGPSRLPLRTAATRGAPQGVVCDGAGDGRQARRG